MHTGIILLFPEIFIFLMSCIILIVDLFISKFNKNFIYYAFQFVIIISILGLLYLSGHTRCVLFDGAFVFDFLSIILKVSLLLTSLVVFLYSNKYIEFLRINKGEYFTLCLMSILGMMIMISSGNFLSLYLGLELLALPIYSLIIMNKSDTSTEASMKYFIIGSISSGIFLFGVSLIYGVSGTIELNLINKMIMEDEVFSNVTLQYGLIFIFSGLIFKFGAVPFHVWVPDVYEGSPIPVTLFIGTIPKIAALGMGYRLLADTFSNMNNELEFLFMIVGIVSLFIGNIFAISQLNIKRMLAYSAISHVGFIFLGFLVYDSNDYSAVIFYVIAYVISSVGIFGMIILFSTSSKERDLISDFKGLGKFYPLLGIIMTLFLFSLAGVPPTVGFYAKFFVLKNLISYGYIEVALFSVLISVVGAFYYLRVIKVIFFENDIDLDNTFSTSSISKFGLFIICINGFLILLLGMYPNFILNFCYKI